MPVEIRELVVKATIVQDSNAAAGGSGQTVSSNNGVTSNEEIINTCVEKVLEILKDKHGR
ncbi:MAG: DUF5908 family protein [Agriterribacter sp.]